MTKASAHDTSKYADFEMAVLTLKNHCARNGITKLAFARHNSGIDELKWPRVRKILNKVFGDTDIDIARDVQLRMSAASFAVITRARAKAQRADPPTSTPPPHGQSAGKPNRVLARNIQPDLRTQCQNGRFNPKCIPGSPAS